MLSSDQVALLAGKEAASAWATRSGRSRVCMCGVPGSCSKGDPAIRSAIPAGLPASSNCLKSKDQRRLREARELPLKFSPWKARHDATPAIGLPPSKRSRA